VSTWCIGVEGLEEKRMIFCLLEKSYFFLDKLLEKSYLLTVKIG